MVQLSVEGRSISIENIKKGEISQTTGIKRSIRVEVELQ